MSQVAIDLTQPRGRVLGVDLIPVQPPKGVSTIQGDFLSPHIQAEIKSFLRDPDRGRLRRSPQEPLMLLEEQEDDPSLSSSSSYVERESRETLSQEGGNDETDDRSVDVVLSDMCEPWDPLDGLAKRSISNPYRRLMNTSGNAFRDHAGSMVSPFWREKRKIREVCV